MAAYAALTSLLHTVEQIQNHRRHSISLNKEQIKSLQEKVTFLQGFIESYSFGGSKLVEILERYIASAAHAAEDVIESHVMDQILGHGEKNYAFLPRLNTVIDAMDYIKKKIMEIKEEGRFKNLEPTYPMHAASPRPLTTRKNIMVGFDDESFQLRSWLIGHEPSRQIISIVGMGGIGKTTLATNVYEIVAATKHFDICAWITVSQGCNAREILLQLLSHRKLGNNENCVAFNTKLDHELGDQLHKSLWGRRYLIVLDDVWSSEVWDKIRLYCPNNSNGSRIVVTSRLSNLAISFGSLRLSMNFLDKEKSWNLFCEKAFRQEGRPHELEEIGRIVANKCRGLPLSIVVVAGLLATNKTREHWEKVAKDIHLHLSESNILSLSYNHLPAHLRPCFLYMVMFPEDHEIRVSRLIKLWVAEGFLKPNKSQSLEEVGEGYLKDLIDRNLILAHRLGLNGKIKTCKIHDVLRDLCLRVAEKEKFICAMRELDVPTGMARKELDVPRGIDRARRIVFHEGVKYLKHPSRSHALRSASLARSFISEGKVPPFKLRFLRVLDVLYSDSPESILQHVNLRMLRYQITTGRSRLVLPPSISLLWNVQIIIIQFRARSLNMAPPEIWTMVQLRHLECNRLFLPDPPSSHQQDDLILPHLRTLLVVVDFRWSEELCKRIPNIRRLCIQYDSFSHGCEENSYYCLQNLGLLQKLESLKCDFPYNCSNLLQRQSLKFPSSLRKLSLSNSKLYWDDLSMIGSLPYLEVLKLQLGSVKGPGWNTVEGEFLCLKVLEIHGCSDLIYWTADSSHFPVLEKLVLQGLKELDEIPSGIGEIPTLKLIRVDLCSESAAISAMRILQEHESFGNEDLRVRVLLWEKADIETKKKMEAENFTSSNFLLEVVPDKVPLPYGGCIDWSHLKAAGAYRSGLG